MIIKRINFRTDIILYQNVIRNDKLLDRSQFFFTIIGIKSETIANIIQYDIGICNLIFSVKISNGTFFKFFP